MFLSCFSPGISARRLAVAAVLFAALGVVSDRVCAQQDKIWFGTLKSIEFKKLSNDSENMVLRVMENEEEQNIREFENESIHRALSSGGKRLELILDGVFPGEFEGKTIQSNLFGSVTITARKGFAEQEGEIFTRTDELVKSTVITIESEKPFVDTIAEPEATLDSVTIVIHLTQVSEQDDVPEIQISAEGDMIELQRSDFDDPFAINIYEPELFGGYGRMPDERNPLIKRLEEIPDEAFITAYYPVRYIDPTQISSLLSHKLSVLGDISVNRDTGILIITDYNNYVRAIIQAVDHIDTRSPQVLIEVRIVEITTTDEEQFGGNLDASFNNNYDPVRVFQNMGVPVTQNFSGAGGVFNVGDSDLDVIDTAISALIKQDRAKLLAHPRILALNNQKATFHAGDRIPITRRTGFSVDGSRDASRSRSRERYRSDTWDASRDQASSYSDVYDDDINDIYSLNSRSSSYDRDYTRVDRDTRDRSVSESASESDSYEYVDDYIETGITLNVTPTILNSNEVTLELDPSYDEVTGFSPVTYAPILSSRELSSTVRVRDGETLMLAGLFREKQVEMEAGFPVLRRIPIVKWLFGRKQKKKVRSEIVFILKINLAP